MKFAYRIILGMLLVALAIGISPIYKGLAAPDTETLRPNAVGDKSSCVPFPNGGEDNYEDVDEVVADGDATYVTVFALTPAQIWLQDLYNISNSTGTGEINSVTVFARFRGTGAGNADVAKIIMKTGGTIYESSVKTITTSYGDYTEQWPANPDTGKRWTWGEIDALQIGVSQLTIDIPSSRLTPRCTQVYAEVDYTLALSDISNALYYGTIIVSNNSTATSNVAVNCTISTQSLIDGGYLNSSANNCVVRGSAGADLPFMPSVNASYPWSIWVPAIGSNASTADILYTANSTGGEIRYFPDTDGMETPDSATLEPGDNFTIEQSGWVDTSLPSDIIFMDGFYQDGWTDFGAGVGVDVVDARLEYDRVGGDHRSYFDIGTANISDTSWSLDYTWYPDTSGAVAFFSFGLWETTKNAAAYPDDAITMQSGVLQVYFVSYNEGAQTTSDTIVFALDTTYYVTLARIASDNVSLSVFTDADRTTHLAGSPVTKAIPATTVGLRYIQASSYNTATGTSKGWFDDVGMPYYYEQNLVKKDIAFDTYISDTEEITSWANGVTVTATGVSSGEYRITTTANTTHMWIDIDGVTQDTVALGGASVPDNSANWTYYYNMDDYWHYTDIEIDGVEQQRIEWEYSENFTDLSGNGHWAIPTFRTTSSDPDVSAVLTSFLPVSEAKAPAYALEDAPGFIETVPTIVSQWAVTPPAGTFPLARVIVAVAGATGTPAQLPLLIIAGFVIIACSLAVSGTMRKYGSGSLIIKTIVITALMGVFIAVGNFGIDFWMLFVFLVIAVALSMGSKQVGWQ